MALQDLTPQLRTRLNRVEKLVGLFLFVAVACVGVGLYFYVRHVLKSRGYGLKKIPYYTYVADSTGLQKNTPVKMMGFTVGEVTEVDRGPDMYWMVQSNLNVVVKFIVREPYFDYIWTDSKVKVGAGDFLGTRAIEVTRGRDYQLTVGNWRSLDPWVANDEWSTESYLNNSVPLTYVRLSQRTNGFFLLADEQPPLPVKLAQIAERVDSALPGVLAMTNKLDAALGSLVSLTAQLDKAMPTVTNAVGKFDGLIGDIRPLTQKTGGIGELLFPTTLIADVHQTLSNVNERFSQVGPALSNLNRLVDQLSATMTNINTQLERDTNLVADVGRLANEATELADTANTLLRRHWLFRSAYKTNKSEAKAAQGKGKK
jgi:ABC-type transporter Mla subunit MlaD